MENKQNQIEEMAKDMLGKDYAIVIIQAKSTTLSDNVKKYCQRLIEEGYRKIPENAVVLTREEYQRSKGFSREEVDEMSETAIKNARKETAEKLSERFKEKMKSKYQGTGLWWTEIVLMANEICKEITGGKV